MNKDKKEMKETNETMKKEKLLFELVNEKRK